MYDINLIRHSVIPKRHRYIMLSIAAAAGLACVITILCTVFFATANSSTIQAYAHETEKLETDLAEVYPGTPTEHELESMISNVAPDLKRIGEIIDGRTETTLIWEAIAEAVPDSIWITAVRVTTPDRDSAAKSKRSSAPGGWISVEGLALVDGGAGGTLIRRFAKRLEQSSGLAGVVSGSRFVETGMRQIGSANVLGFEITCPFE